MNEPPTQTAYFHTDIDEDGAILIPADLRKLMGIEPGDHMMWVRNDHGIQLRKKE